MNSYQMQEHNRLDDELYLKIWQAEQEFVKTRWTVITFFLSVSFAILGYSFQSNLASSQALAIRIFGIFVYWFAYLLYMHFYRYTKSLRSYLIKMEDTGRTTFNIQSSIGKSPDFKRHLATSKLLVYFGVICSIGVILLSLLKL